MAARTTVTKEKLLKLDAGHLADILIDLAKSDAAIKRRLRLELAGNQRLLPPCAGNAAVTGPYGKKSTGGPAYGQFSARRLVRRTCRSAIECHKLETSVSRLGKPDQPINLGERRLYTGFVSLGG